MFSLIFREKGACFVLKFNLHQEQTEKEKKRHDVNRKSSISIEKNMYISWTSWDIVPTS